MAKESTFRVFVVGCQELQEIYQKLHLREGMPVILTPKRAECTIHVESKKGLISLGKSEYLGYLLGSEALLFQIERGYKINNPQFVGYHDHDWGKELVLEITVVKPRAEESITIVGCSYCRRLNLKTDLTCRSCQKRIINRHIQSSEEACL
jgi:hypothetical protein